MRSLSLALSVISLLMIAYQDYRSRAVYWILFPLLALGGMGMGAAGQSFPRMLSNIGFNLAFLILQLALLKVYFLARYRFHPTAGANTDRQSAGPPSPETTLIDKKIGLGDILFMTAACTFCSPINFIAFYILSLFFAITIWLSMNSGRGRWFHGRTLSGIRQAAIPLAGLQAVFLLLTLCAASCWKYSLLDDDLLIRKITGL